MIDQFDKRLTNLEVFSFIDNRCVVDLAGYEFKIDNHAINLELHYMRMIQHLACNIDTVVPISDLSATALDQPDYYISKLDYKYTRFKVGRIRRIIRDYDPLLGDTQQGIIRTIGNDGYLLKSSLLNDLSTNPT